MGNLETFGHIEKGRSVGGLLHWVTRLGRGGGWPGYQGSSAIGPLLPSSYGGALTPQVAPTTSLMAWDCHVIPTREEGCDPERRQQSDYTTRNTSNSSKHATHNIVCITSQLKTLKTYKRDIEGNVCLTHFIKMELDLEEFLTQPLHLIWAKRAPGKN